MNKALTVAAAAICTAFLLTGCAETRDPGESDIGIHPRDWATPGSDNNHAAELKREGLPNSAQACGKCHGADFGSGTDDDCFACHAEGGPHGHPVDFDLRTPEPFHGDVVIDDQGTDACVACHSWVGEGETEPDLNLGGWSQQSCDTCHAGGRSGHAATDVWVGDPGSSEFHGQVVIDDSGTDHCALCHATDVGGVPDFSTGGWSQQSCETCHAGGRSGHPGANDWFNPISPQFHGAAAAGADIAGCADCHGADYLGGWTGLSCNTCHAAGAVAIHPNTWIGGAATPGTHGYLLTTQSPATEPALTDETCRGCHGADLQGGWSGRDCTPCHSF